MLIVPFPASDNGTESREVCSSLLGANRVVQSDSSVSRARREFVQAWWAAVKERPSVANTFVSEGRLIASYKQYANNTGTSDFAKALQGAIATPAAAPVAPMPSSIAPGKQAPAAADSSAIAEENELPSPDATVPRGTATVSYTHLTLPTKA